MLDINLRGSFTVCKYVTAVMKKQQKGVIILTASGAGVLGGSSSLAYGSSKGGVHGLSLVMDAHLSKHGIRVNDVLPGSVDTPHRTESHRSWVRSASCLHVLATRQGVQGRLPVAAGGPMVRIREQCLR